MAEGKRGPQPEIKRNNKILERCKEQIREGIPLKQVFHAVGQEQEPKKLEWRTVRNIYYRLGGGKKVGQARQAPDLKVGADPAQQAVIDNPGDGRAVARLILTAPTIAAVETLYSDFHSYSYQASAEHVAAARRIRQAHAEGVKDIPWEFSVAAERAMAPFGREKYRRAMFDLIAEFPQFGGPLFEGAEE